MTIKEIITHDNIFEGVAKGDVFEGFSDLYMIVAVKAQAVLIGLRSSNYYAEPININDWCNITYEEFNRMTVNGVRNFRKVKRMKIIICED